MPTPKAAQLEFGERLARLRKERGLTQVELAASLGTVQAVVSNYERGSLRMHGEMIVLVAAVLRVSTDELLGVAPTHHKPILRDRRLLRRLAAIERLSRRNRQALVRTIDAFLTKAESAESPSRRTG